MTLCKQEVCDLLNLYVGEQTYNLTVMSDVDGSFDALFEREWFVDEDVRQIIKDIDGSIVLDDCSIESPYLGNISYSWLSTGTKLMILILKYEDTSIIYNGDLCGDNCSDWLLKIASRKDVHMAVTYPKAIDLEKNKASLLFFPEQTLVDTNIEYWGNLLHLV